MILMKKSTLLLTQLLLTASLSFQSIAHAANLIEVYHQAQLCDPIFQEAIAQRLSTKQGVPISVAAILPNIQLTNNPSITRTGYAGSNFDPVMSNSGTYINPRNLTTRGYTMSLTLTQTVFNFAQFSEVARNVSLSKGA